MMIDHNTNSQNKLSPEFSARLTHLEPHQKIQIIVLLKIAEPANMASRRQSATERQATIQTIKNSAAQALNKITGIIQHFDGRSLAEYPDSLGSLPIEITPLGINALIESDAVKVIMESQDTFLSDKT
jgi:hypothetical protein